LAVGTLTLDPLNDANDLRIEGEVVFSVGHPEKAAPFLVAHRPPQAPRKQRKLFIRRRICPWLGPAVASRPPLANPQLLCFRSRVYSRASFAGDHFSLSSIECYADLESSSPDHPAGQLQFVIRDDQCESGRHCGARIGKFNRGSRR